MKCINENRTELSGIEDTEKIRTLCLEKYEYPLSIKSSDSKGGYHFIKLTNRVEFRWNFKNTSSNKIITYIKIKVKHDDNIDENNKPKSEIYEKKNLWILPGESGSFWEHVSFKIKKDRFIEKETDQKDKKPIFHWSVSEIRGLSFVFED